MIRKLFALLALVGLTVAPSTTWAATYDGTLEVKTWSQGGGTVSASQTTTAGEYGTTESSHYQQSQSMLAPATKSFHYHPIADSVSPRLD